MKPGPKGPNRTTWRPGQSGNPGGKSRGLSAATKIARKLLDENAQEIIERSIARAIAGDNAVDTKFWLSRAVPEGTVGVGIACPEAAQMLKDGAPLEKVVVEIVRQVANAELDQTKAAALVSMISTLLRVRLPMGLNVEPSMSPEEMRASFAEVAKKLGYSIAPIDAPKGPSEEPTTY